MTTEPLATNEAKDDTTEYERYPTYSLAVLWSMKALTPEEFEAAAVSPTPLDGDAMARTRFQELRLADAWDKLNAAMISRLKGNHHLINRSGRG
jgi:hypothetical protein